MVVFFSGCNYQCPFCFTPQMLGFKQETLIDLRQVKKLIMQNNVAQAVMFTGGEPCLQKLALLELAMFCKSAGFKVGLETNGSRPDVLEEALQNGLVDFIRMDVKSPLDDAAIFDRVTVSSTFFRSAPELADDVRASLEILHSNESDIELELRTTIVPHILYKKEDILNIATMLKGFKSAWVLQKFMPKPALANPRFSSIKPPSDEFMETIHNLVKKEYPFLRVELRLDMADFSQLPDTDLKEFRTNPEEALPE